MQEYHKIDSIFKRHPETGRLIDGDYSNPAFGYLADCQWVFTEKVDGTNVRVGWDGERITWGGRTANAQIPTFLLSVLDDMFSGHAEARNSVFAHSDVILFGEGYGPKIQKGGNYRSDVSFVLFDVMIGGIYLERSNVEDIGKALGVDVVPVIGHGTLHLGVVTAAHGFSSRWNGSYMAEGIVARPVVELQDRRGRRVITKIKYKDFH